MNSDTTTGPYAAGIWCPVEFISGRTSDRTPSCWPVQRTATGLPPTGSSSEQAIPSMMGRRRYRPPRGRPVNCRSLRCLARETPIDASSSTERPNRWGLAPHELRREVERLEEDNAALRRCLDRATKALQHIAAASTAKYISFNHKIRMMRKPFFVFFC